MPSEYAVPFINALNEYPDRLRSLSSDGQKSIGYFCTYTPVEIIHAAGFLPIRIMGGKGPVEKAYSLAPDFICPYMKRSLEKALAGEFDFLSGIIQGYTCDVACGLINIWEENIGGKLFHTLPFPYMDSRASRIFFRAEISRLGDHLNQIGGTYTPGALEKSLSLYDEIRTLILGLNDTTVQNQLVTAGDLFYIVQAGAVMPPEAYLDMLLMLKKNRGYEPEPLNGIPVLISGSLIESSEVFKTIEALGGQVVADDLCSGTRHLNPAKGEGNDAVGRLIDRHFKRFPCPSRARATRRASHLDALVKKSGAKGVIFLIQKFCTPHLSDYPVLADALKKKNIPCTLIEMDETWSVEGQFKTRLEGFFEMLDSTRSGSITYGKNEKVNKTP